MVVLMFGSNLTLALLFSPETCRMHTTALLFGSLHPLRHAEPRCCLVACIFWDVLSWVCLVACIWYIWESLSFLSITNIDLCWKLSLAVKQFGSLFWYYGCSYQLSLYYPGTGRQTVGCGVRLALHPAWHPGSMVGLRNLCAWVVSSESKYHRS